jgi:hypothetical protein
MKRYRFNEGEISIPEAWEDQSIQMFRLPEGPDTKEASVVITRDYATPVENPLEYASAQKDLFTKQFPGFKFLGQTETTIGDRTAVLVDYQWQANGMPLRQKQAYMKAQDCMIALTLSSRSEDFQKYEPAWSHVISSFKFTK